MNAVTTLSNKSREEENLIQQMFQEERRGHLENERKARDIHENRESVDIPLDIPPPKPEEIDQWQRNVKIQAFGEELQTIADAYFPNTATSRYKNVYVLILKWDDEDPNLPVSYETERLESVFRDVYFFQTETWDIPDMDCHDKVNQKILDFKRQGGNSQNDLKIVYYGGHGKLTRNGSLAWTRYNPLFGTFYYN
jgi:hypothetical protein